MAEVRVNMEGLKNTVIGINHLSDEEHGVGYELLKILLSAYEKGEQGSLDRYGYDAWIARLADKVKKCNEALAAISVFLDQVWKDYDKCEYLLLHKIDDHASMQQWLKDAREIYSSTDMIELVTGGLRLKDAAKRLREYGLDIKDFIDLMSAKGYKLKDIMHALAGAGYDRDVLSTQIFLMGGDPVDVERLVPGEDGSEGGYNNGWHFIPTREDLFGWLKAPTEEQKERIANRKGFIGIEDYHTGGLLDSRLNGILSQNGGVYGSPTSEGTNGISVGGSMAEGSGTIRIGPEGDNLRIPYDWKVGTLSASYQSEGEVNVAANIFSGSAGLGYESGGGTTDIIVGGSVGFGQQVTCINQEQHREISVGASEGPLGVQVTIDSKTGKNGRFVFR